MSEKVLESTKDVKPLPKNYRQDFSGGLAEWSYRFEGRQCGS
jgi:hypothetical protein